MENFIPGIYNYCDRWCEKCAFTARCRNYSRHEEDVYDENGEFDSEKFVAAISNSLAEAMRLIKETVEADGGDWETFYKEAQETEIEEPVPTAAEQQLLDWSEQYYKKIRPWFKENNQWLKDKSDELLQKAELGIEMETETLQLSEALDIIQFYLYFIHIKLKRASGDSEDEWIKENFPIQNDANGSAKIALIATERTLAAWQVIYAYFPEKQDELLDVLMLLEKIRRGIEKTFPDVHRFIRPGFDQQPKEKIVRR